MNTLNSNSNSNSTTDTHKTVDQALSTIGVSAITHSNDPQTLLQALGSCQRLVEHQRQSARIMHQLMCTLFWQLLDIKVSALDHNEQSRVKVDLSQARTGIFEAPDLLPHLEKMLKFRSLDGQPMASMMGMNMTRQTHQLLQSTYHQFISTIATQNQTPTTEQQSLNSPCDSDQPGTTVHAAKSTLKPKPFN